MNALQHSFQQRTSWYDTAAGRAQLEAEARFFSTHLSRITGFQGVQVLPSKHMTGLVEQGRFRHFVSLWQAGVERLDGDFQAWVDCLPLCSELFDVVLLAHVLDWQHDPLPLLNEWTRLLRPGGRLLLTMNRAGIGPWFPWPGPPVPEGYMPWMTRRKLQNMGLELISRQWLLPVGASRQLRLNWLASMRAPVVGLHLRKTRRQTLIQPLSQPAGAAVPLP